MSRCPGQIPRGDLSSTEIECPSCGRVVEMFSDEGRARCKCGHEIRREALPSCADWCPAAGQCFGLQLDAKVLAERMSKIRDDPVAKECVQRIRRLVDASEKLHSPK